MSKEIVQQFSTVRIELSTILNTMNKMSKTQISRGLALSITSLEKGRMYLGEVQGALGQEFPYEATKKAKTPQEIQEAVEVSKMDFVLEDNEIVNLNNLRELIGRNLDIVLNGFMTYAEQRKTKDMKAKFVQDASFAEAYRSIKEARMWLGVRLGEIKSNG